MNAEDAAVWIATDPAVKRRGLGEFLKFDLPGGRHGRLGIRIRSTPTREVDTAIAWFYALTQVDLSLGDHEDHVVVYVRGDLEGQRVQAHVPVYGTAAVRLRAAAEWDPFDSASISVHGLRRVAVDVSDLVVWR